MEFRKEGDYLGRVEAIDVLKGILIVLVVFGHSIQFMLYGGAPGPAHFADPVFQAIYMFHMPLFMALSGFVSSRPDGFFKQLRKRGEVLLGPTISWAVLMVVLTFIVTDKSVGDILGMVPGMFLMLWFLPCLFVSWVVTVGMDILFREFSLRIRAMLCVLSFVLLLLFPDHNLFPHLKYTFPFFVMGFYFSELVKIKSFKPLINYYAAIASLIVFIVCFYLWSPNTYFYVSGFTLTFDGMQSIVLRYVAAISGSIFVVSFSLIIQRAINFNFIKFIGFNSLYVYIAQMVFYRIVGYVHLFVDYTGIYSYVLLFAMSVILSWLFVYIGMIGVKFPIIGPLFWGK